jgi:uncharacterized protein (DUF1501 family)
MTIPGNYISPTTRATLQAATPLSGYKALICLFMFGATDSHQMVVPYGTNPNLIHYESARPVGVRITQAELAASILSGTSNQWALHPNLPHFLARWNAGDLAIVRNVGTLNEPTTKADYLNDLATNNGRRYQPLGLFAHNTQQDIWRAALGGRGPRTTGWFGRTSDLIDSIFNPGLRVHSSTAAMGAVELQGVPYSPEGYLLVPPTLRDEMDTLPSPNAAVPGALRAVLSYQDQTSLSPFSNPAAKRNAIKDALKSLYLQGVNQQATVSSNLLALTPAVAAIFTAARSAATAASLGTGLITQAENAVRCIVSRVSGPPGFNVNRQLLFMSRGGFDNHNNLRANHDPLLMEVGMALKALHDALAELNLVNSVTVFTESDFGRTLRSNGTLGTDHAWAGHCFVIGGAVNGGLYGAEPNYEIGGPESDNSPTGRFIPSISTEQYYSTLLRWFDVPASLLPLILPATDPARANPLPNTSLGFV